MEVKRSSSNSIGPRLSQLQAPFKQLPYKYGTVQLDDETMIFNEKVRDRSRELRDQEMTKRDQLRKRQERFIELICELN